MSQYMGRLEWVLRHLYERQELSAHELRALLNEGRGWWFRRVQNSRFCFNFLMVKMERLGLVEYTDMPRELAYGSVKVRYYRLTEETLEELKLMKEINDDIKTL